MGLKAFLPFPNMLFSVYSISDSRCIKQNMFLLLCKRLKRVYLTNVASKSTSCAINKANTARASLCDLTAPFSITPRLRETIQIAFTGDNSIGR